ncbi:MAG: TlpA disulfide reductase family protein [Melioribacteraceae bacterium]
MMNKILVVLILLLQVLNIDCKAQEITIEIFDAKEKAFLLELEGEKTNLIDSVYSQNGKYTFSLENKTVGLYRLQFDSRHEINFINDGKDILIKTDYNNILDSLLIVKSENNRLYYEFIRLNKLYKKKTELLNIILLHYPSDDEYYKVTQNKLEQIQNEYHKFIQKTSQANPKSFIARYIKSAQLPIVHNSIPIEGQITFLKKHSLDNVNFDDAELISSDMFTNKSIEYLTYYRNQQLPKELLEKEFMKAVDTLLNKAKMNQLVYQYITEYLIDGFKKFGFDKIIDYIVENYVIEDDLCLDEQTENSIQRRIDQAKILAKGSKAPNIIMPSKDGKVIDLSKIKSQKVLLVFYASWCPHCKTLLPKLNNLNTNSEELEIIAISLDNTKEDWLKFINENCSELTNLNDQNGWDGTVASEYFIYATPSMFLLDREKKIIGKPTSYDELKDLLDSH